MGKAGDVVSLAEWRYNDGARRESLYAAARMADSLRKELLAQRESFAFETVFSDPIGEKIGFLREASASGSTTILCFIGISGHTVSDERVAMRVSQGGHDVPPVKLAERFPRTIANLKLAAKELPHVWVFDNDDLGKPFRLVAVVGNGSVVQLNKPVPKWFKTMLR